MSVEKDGHADLNIGLLVVIGIVSVLLLVQIVVVAEAYFYNTLEREITVKQVQGEPQWELSELTHSQQAELNSYRWVDRERQRVSIPIDRAIQRYVDRQVQRAATRPG